jgi:hypothetical protein
VATNSVFLLGPEDIEWPLGVQETTPQYRFGVGQYPRVLKVDPYPAYAHDPERVEAILSLCMSRFPLGPKTKFGLYILSHDLVDRTNGVTFEDTVYRRDDGSEWDEEIPHWDGSGEKRKFYGQAINIALAGKRIPIMPAMTRYLVAHEYGHAVFDYISRCMGYKDHEQDKLKGKYMAARGIPEGEYELKYKGGKWHAAPGEIIANDFRVLFTKQEVEFWPHDCPLPSWDGGEGLWWGDAAALCGVNMDLW